MAGPFISLIFRQALFVRTETKYHQRLRTEGLISSVFFGPRHCLLGIWNGSLSKIQSRAEEPVLKWHRTLEVTLWGPVLPLKLHWQIFALVAECALSHQARITSHKSCRSSHGQNANALIPNCLASSKHHGYCSMGDIDQLFMFLMVTSCWNLEVPVCIHWSKIDVSFTHLL